MWWKNDFQHEIKDKCRVDVVNIITVEITSEGSQHQTTGDITERGERPQYSSGGGDIIIILSVNN